ncbi:MAG: ATP-binding protein [Bacteroidales bacterium]|nr:ATP-binding protein [Bacteroidales bacterium]
MSTVSHINKDEIEIKKYRPWIYTFIVLLLHIIAGLTVYYLVYSNLVTIANMSLRQNILTTVLSLIVLNFTVFLVIVIHIFKRNQKYSNIINSIRNENTDYRKVIVETQQLLLEEKNKNEFLTKDLDLKQQQIETYETKLKYNNIDLEKASQQILELQQVLNVAKERAEIGDRLKSAFIACIHHEIRTPINIINGFAMLVSSPDLTPERKKEYSEKLITSSKRFMDVIDDIMYYSQIQSGYVEPIANTFNLNLLLSSLNMQFDLIIGQLQKSLKLKFNCNLKEKTYISCYEEGLKNIISKLIDNAIKFSKSGTINIDSNISNGHLLLSVSDQGIGIPSNKFDEIFESFVQLDNELDRKYFGIGLGLSICKRLVYLMGGDINVESKENMGSTFTLNIPIGIQPQVPVDLYNQISQCLNNETFNGKILVVTKSLGDSYFLVDFFNQFKCETLCVSNLEQAQTILNENPQIFISIIDLVYPSLKGCDIASELLNISPELKFIFISSRPLNNQELEKVSLYSKEILLKPIVTADILSPLNRLLILKKMSLH